MKTSIDHVVILIPYEYLVEPPSWITDNFTLTAGGKWADNKTENRLIIFQDGTFIELVAFIDDSPEKRHGHWWDKPFGMVDFSLNTFEKPLDHGKLLERLEVANSAITYAEPRFGGRVTNGREVQWKVTFSGGSERGYVPFFTEDITPRDWRVPITHEETTHACEAIGIAGVLLEVNESQLEKLSIANAAILDIPKQEAGRYNIGVPRESEGHDQAFISLQRAQRGSLKDLSMILTLRTADIRLRASISEQVGDGSVDIRFEPRLSISRDLSIESVEDVAMLAQNKSSPALRASDAQLSVTVENNDGHECWGAFVQMFKCFRLRRWFENVD